jgi:hypothetical protein
MAIIQISQIQQRTGNLVDLPQLNEAEFGWATDTKQLFIGKTTPVENIEVLTSYSALAFDQLTGAVGNLNITASSLSVGEVLAYNGTDWVNSGGTTGGNINLGNVSNVRIGGGASGYVLQTDGTGNLNWTVQTGGGGGPAAAAGANTQIQYNNSGIFGASSGLTYDFANSILRVNGNANIGNLNAANLVSASLFSSNIANGTPPLSVQSSTQVPNLHATYANVVTNSAQPNITSVGTLTSLAVTNDVTSGNVYANSGIIKAQYLKGDGSNITNISVAAGSYIVNGTSNASLGASGNFNVEVGGVANVLQVTSAGAIVTGYMNANTISGNLTTAAQPNITSLGTLNNITVGAANSITGGNLLSATYLTGTLTTAAQPNITSVGTLSSLVTSGSILTGGYTQISGYTSQVGIKFAGSSSQFGLAMQPTTDVTTLMSFFNAAGTAVGGITQTASNVTFNGLIAGANVTGAVAFATTANSVAGANVSGAVAFATTANSVAGGNVSGAVAFATTANSVAGGNVSGTVANATYATSSGTAAVANSVAGANVVGAVASATTSNSVSQSVTFNNSGSGTPSGFSYNGASSLTVSYNTIGALAPASFTGANQQLATNGFQVLPGGLIMNWGLAGPFASREGAIIVTLQKPFTTAMLNATATIQNPTGADSAADQSAQVFISDISSPVSTLGVYLQYNGGGSSTTGLYIYWQAIGY